MRHDKRSLYTVLIFAATTIAGGCGRQEQTAPSAPEASETAAKTDGAHAHGEGPHGGVLADWGGGEYHVEFTVDHDQQQATVYVLGGDAKSPAPVSPSGGALLLLIDDPEFQAPLEADPQSEDPAGAASRFVAAHENLGVVQEFSGTISGELDGVPYAGDFAETPHSSAGR